MKIGVIGTRGIPNHYGGFEQFAEYLSQFLVKKGHDVTVYNSHTHPYQQKTWNGVHIIHQRDPEDKLGTIGQFIYDFNCIKDARLKDFDIILQLGYTSSAIWGWLLPKHSIIITNMDGLEWKRSKYSAPVRKFLKYSERLAIKYSDALVADSIGIEKYIEDSYSLQSQYIPYGAHLFNNPSADYLEKYKVTPFNYNMLIARLEPENSIDMILEGVVIAQKRVTFLVFGNYKTKYGQYLTSKYKKYESIKFVGTTYDINELNNLRYYSENYFHGHTVGGTNPSLLEAMASGALINAHNNIFNKSILENNANYFTSHLEVSDIIENSSKSTDKSQKFIETNYAKIRTIYSWEEINNQYLNFMIDNLGKVKNPNVKTKTAAS